ncbi:MAG: hypothetical protein QM817_30725 [Archangium sp.]
MRRALLFLGVIALVTAACTGVFFDKGNAFPCDFNAGLGVRDAVCVTGDVCGTDNLCHSYIYEGPRFEGPARVPTFEDNEFTKLHPLTLDQPVVFLARAPTAESGPLIAQLADGRVITSNKKGQLATSPNPPDASIRDAVFYRGEFELPGNNVVEAQALAGVRALPGQYGPLAYFAVVIDGGPSVSNSSGDIARSLRITPPAGHDLLPTLQGITPPQGGPQGQIFAGEIGLGPPALEFKTLYPLSIDAGDPIDVGLLMRSAPLVTPEPVILTQTALWVMRTDAGFDEFPAGPFPGTAVMRFNGPGTLMSVETANVLSAWQIGVTRGEHTLQQPWADCTPCRGTGNVMRRATPLPPQLGLGVEVFCFKPSGPGQTEPQLQLLQVTGSTAVMPSDPCTTETVALPLDTRQLNVVTNMGTQVSVVGAAGQRGVAVGGKAGQVWFGETLSTMQPINLDRVPLDVTTTGVEADGVTSNRLLAITDRYTAVNQPPVLGKLPSGFRRLDALEFGGKSSLTLLAAIHGIEGWGIQNDGVLVKFDIDESEATDSTVSFGPRIVTPAGQPIAQTIGGEAFLDRDGGPLAMVIAADDALYYVQTKDVQLGEQSLTSLAPELQPEPSVPIRSLALERTPLGTDGVDRARGYLVTSRNVFEWKLGGAPARWSSRPLIVSDGEPMEVWFDTTRSALGRVGYSDGRIFTLPGGYQLSVPLPAADGGTLKILDYENFGGWPVVLARHGLFVARWDTDPSGKLLNKFPDGGVNRPMEWREITQPGGLRPWADREHGKLFVSSERIADAGTEYKLFVFVDDAVYQAGAFTR